MNKFAKIKEWMPEHGGAVFPSWASWVAFKFKHREELINSGAVIIRRGTGGDLLNTELFEQVIEDILFRESKAA